MSVHSPDLAAYVIDEEPYCPACGESYYNASCGTIEREPLSRHSWRIGYAHCVSCDAALYY